MDLRFLPLILPFTSQNDDCIASPSSKSAYYRRRKELLKQAVRSEPAEKLRKTVQNSKLSVQHVEAQSTDTSSDESVPEETVLIDNLPVLASETSDSSSDDNAGSSPDVIGASDVHHVSEATQISVSLSDTLKSWAIAHNVPNSTVSALLKGLQYHNISVPCDARTLLGGVRNINLETMGSGHYYNFGLQWGIGKQIDRYKPECDTIFLNFNIDGLPVFKSSAMQLYPTLCQIHINGVRVRPFVCAAFAGNSKPPIEEYLKDLAPELEAILQHGMAHNGKQYIVKLRCFVCDTPARSWVKNIKGHTAYYGCDRCTPKGRWLQRMTFPETNAPLRTDESFRLQAQSEHHSGECLLSDDKHIGMMSQFVGDFLHVACLGVMRKLCHSWCNGLSWQKSNRIFKKMLAHQGAASKRRISERLIAARDWWPSEFRRKPRRLDELDRWKGTEFRQFLLYLGPAVLPNILRKKLVKNFLLFHVSMTILSRVDTCHTLNTEAQSLVKKFVEDCKDKYGEQFLSYNVHSLVHLPDDCNRFGPLDSFSGFDFENELQSIKKMIRGKNRCLEQLVGRVLEQSSNVHITSTLNERVTFSLTSQHTSAHDAGLEGEQFKKCFFQGHLLSTKKGDNVVMLHSKAVVIALNFIVSEGEKYLVGRKFRSKLNAYSKPIESHILDIFPVKDLAMRPIKWPLETVKCKVLLVPPEEEGSYFAYPLVNPISI